MKRKSLLFISILALFSLVFLSAGLNNLQFAPPLSGNFGGETVQPADENLAQAVRGFEKSPLWKQGLWVGGFFLVLLLSLIFMPAEFRKAFLTRLFWLIIFAIIVFAFVKPSDSEPQISLPEENLGSAYDLETGEDIVGTPPTVYEEPEIAPIWGYLISFAIVLIAAFLFWRLWRIWDNSRQTEEFPQKKLQRIIQSSLDDLTEGAALADIVIRSYLQMGEVVNERRGIARDVEMTPHEFAERLTSAGLPEKPVHELTLLFERVRYSPHIADEHERALAVASLEEIAASFGEKLHDE